MGGLVNQLVSVLLCYIKINCYLSAHKEPVDTGTGINLGKRADRCMLFVEPDS
jgi:hypothetical protein